MPKNFVRRDSVRYSKIGKNRKKLQKWRKPKGRDNKMRLSRKSYPKVVSVGYKRTKKDLNKIDGKVSILVSNLKDIELTGKEDQIIISGRVGARKKLEIIKKAEENSIKILNVAKGVKK